MTIEPGASPASLLERKAGRRIFLVETFTLRYEAAEDRLRLDATNKAGRIEGIWLTQRLANKLVAALAQDLDRELAEDVGEQDRGGEAGGKEAPRSASPKLPPPAVSAALHGMTQQRLRLERAEAPAQSGRGASSQPTAVQRAPESTRWLCTKIQLRLRPGGVKVIFADDTSVTAQFFMSHRNTRAVLDGLAGKFREANWPLQAFPDWLRELPATSHEAGQVRVLN